MFGTLCSKLFFTTCLFGISMGISVDAALPPLYQNIREYTALLQNPQFAEKLGSGEAILAIHRNEKGFEVLTTHYTLFADVVYDKSENMGPARFHFEFQEPQQR